MMEKIPISKEQLLDLYESKKLTTQKIAKKFNCCQATICKKIKEYNIKLRPAGIKRVEVGLEQLKDLYFNQKLSTWKIAKKLGIPRSTIHRKLKKFKLKTRDRADSHLFSPRKDFSGSLVEKAYIIGFRLGDLGVRKIYPNSKTITVASGSTIPEQIALIRELFSPYCKIWVKETKDGKTNITAPLNESFSFLLAKEIPFWVAKDKQTFFAFLSGFADAEGHMGIYNKMAMFGIGNYDLEMLSFLKEGLEKYDICARINSDSREGLVNNEGYPYRHNYHTLRVSKKKDLLLLFNNIKPYLKHKLKIEALKKAEDNIKERNARFKNNEK